MVVLRTVAPVEREHLPRVAKLDNLARGSLAAQDEGAFKPTQLSGHDLAAAAAGFPRLASMRRFNLRSKKRM